MVVLIGTENPIHMHGPGPKQDVNGVQGERKAVKANLNSNCQTTNTPVHKNYTNYCVLNLKGNKFWKLSMSKNVIGPEEGTLAKDYFHNVKDGSSAVYTRWDGKTVFFRGRS